MPLVDVDITIPDSELPATVAAFLQIADQRLDLFISERGSDVHAFVASNAVVVFHALQAIQSAQLAAGNRFCEWGSGLGVATSLAAHLGFDACGIEIEEQLVDAADSLAAEFGFPSQFVQGSFIPSGGESLVERMYAESETELFWLDSDTDDAYERLGLEPDDFDIIFAYPWPNEEFVIEQLFDRFAADGTLLLSYHTFETVRIRRKV